MMKLLSTEKLLSAEFFSTWEETALSMFPKVFRKLLKVLVFLLAIYAISWVALFLVQIFPPFVALFLTICWIALGGVVVVSFVGTYLKFVDDRPVEDQEYEDYRNEVVASFHSAYRTPEENSHPDFNDFDNETVLPGGNYYKTKDGRVVPLTVALEDVLEKE